MKHILIAITIILLSTAMETQARTPGRMPGPSWGVHIGPSFPLGNFGSMGLDDEQAGYASTGLHATLETVKPLDYISLGSDILFISATGSLSFLANPSRKAEQERQRYDAAVERSDWWVMLNPAAGFRFSYADGPGWRVYTTLQGGALIGRYPVTRLSSEDWSFTPEWGPAVGASLALTAGAGVIVEDFELNLSYLTGAPTYKPPSNVLPQVIVLEKPVHVLTIGFAYWF